MEIKDLIKSNKHSIDWLFSAIEKLNSIKYLGIYDLKFQTMLKKVTDEAQSSIAKLYNQR